MSIYTKTGDTGVTALFGKKRVLKHNVQVESFGAVDELTSFLGWVISVDVDSFDSKLITTIQKDLYKVMAVLAGEKKIDLSSLSKSLSIIEKTIDILDETLPKLSGFVLPQGGEIASRLHITRSVCRRCERAISPLLANVKNDTLVSEKNKKTIGQYVNRLSDLLFMLARKYTSQEILAK